MCTDDSMYGRCVQLTLCTADVYGRLYEHNMVIEQMCMADFAHIKERESYWIHTIRFLAPNGLNLDA